MTDYMRPGPYFEEREAPQHPIAGVATEIAGLVGWSQRGPADKARYFTNYPDYSRWYGELVSGSRLSYAARDYFRNGGRRLWVGRSSRTGGLASELDVDCYPIGDKPVKDTLGKYLAANYGVWGDRIRISDVKASTTLGTKINAGAAVSAVFTSVSGFEVGDKIRINDGTDYIVVIICKIDSATKTAYFQSVTVTVEIAAGATVTTASRHKCITKLEPGSSLVSDQKVFKVRNTEGLKKGSLITVIDQTLVAPQAISVIVAEIIGNQIHLVSDLGTITTIEAATCIIVEQSYAFDIYFGSDLVERHDNISFEATNETDYAPTRLNGISPSISFEMDDTTPPLGIDAIPCGELNRTPLADGADGTAESSTDRYDALALIKPKKEVFVVGVAGAGTISEIQDIFDWGLSCGKFAIGVLDGDTYTTAIDTKELVQENALSASLGAAYWPHGKIKDPLTGVDTDMPPEGNILAAYVRTFHEHGPYMAPAGIINGRLSGLSGLQIETDDDDSEILNPININVIRVFPEAYCLWGARTLSPDSSKRYINQRTSYLYVTKSLEEWTRWIIFRNNDESLWVDTEGEVRRFLKLYWEGKGPEERGLAGTTPEQAFWANCRGYMLGHPEHIPRGECVTLMGVAFQRPMEFSIFRLRQHEAYAIVEELPPGTVA